MHRLIPTIYFYTVSLIGLVLLIIGIFADVHFLINKISYSEYPVPYTTPCIQPQPFPIMKGEVVPVTGTGATGTVKVEKSTAKIAQQMPSGTPTPMQVQVTQPAIPNSYYTDCLQQVIEQRKQVEVADLEKALSFTIVGIIVFGIHFSYARKQSTKAS